MEGERAWVGTWARFVIRPRAKATSDEQAIGGTGCAKSWGWRVLCREMVSRDPQGKSEETVAR